LCEYCHAAWMCIFNDITLLAALYLVCNSDSLLGFLTHSWLVTALSVHWMLVLLDLANLSLVFSCDSHNVYSDTLQPVRRRYYIFCSDFLCISPLLFIHIDNRNLSIMMLTLDNMKWEFINSVLSQYMFHLKHMMCVSTLTCHWSYWSHSLYAFVFQLHVLLVVCVLCSWIL